MLVKWFKDGFITNSAGKKLDDVEISKKAKHAIMKRIWSSNNISLKEKEELMELLAADGTGDWYQETLNFGTAAHFENKEKMWDLFFNPDRAKEMDDWGLHKYQQSFLGFNQVTHRQYTEKFEDEFFKVIGNIIKTKGRYIASAFYYNLRPTNNVSDERI